MVLRGIVGCPVCKREYAIRDGVVEFGGPVGQGGLGGPPGAATAEAAPPAGTAGPDPDAVWALLGLTTPGGFVVLVGSATRLAPPLGARLGGVHFVGVNPTAGVEMAPGLSLLRHPGRIPLRQSMARGVVLGTETAREPWTSEGARVLLRGLRLVAVAENASAPGLDHLASGRGLWVGQKIEPRHS